MSRRPKQLIYGFFYLLVLGGIIFFVFISYLAPSPSCFDKKLNQREEGIDCGGPCSQICFPVDFKEIEVVKTRIFKIDPNHVSLFAEVKNPNTTLAVEDLFYTFSLFDVSDKSLGTFSGESQIHTSQTSYLLVPNISVTSSLAKRVELKIESPNWLTSDNFPKPKLVVGGLETLVIDNNIRVKGTLTNNDAIQFSKVKLIAVIFGRFNQPIGASVTELNRLESNQIRPFEIIHPYLGDLNPDTTKVQILSALP